MDYREHITAEKGFVRIFLPASKRRGERLIQRVLKPYKKVKSDDLERRERDHQSKKGETKEKSTKMMILSTHQIIPMTQMMLIWLKPG